MKQAIILSAVAVLLITIVVTTIILPNNLSNVKVQENQPFYVGVTYGGTNVADAKLLIDRVKNYTNVFIVASGPWQSNNVSALLDVGDYAVASGLNVFINFGTQAHLKGAVSGFIDTVQVRWGSRFLGIY